MSKKTRFPQCCFTFSQLPQHWYKKILKSISNLEVTFTMQIYQPNINFCGNIHLNIINSQWSPRLPPSQLATASIYCLRNYTLGSEFNKTDRDRHIELAGVDIGQRSTPWDKTSSGFIIEFMFKFSVNTLLELINL